MMQKEQDQLTKKAQKRYVYTVSASAESGGRPVVIQIQNISKSGIQFLANQHFADRTQIQITWQDEKVGQVQSNVVIVRQIQHKDKSFLYCYGSKFIISNESIRRNVNRLVETTGEFYRKVHEKDGNQLPFNLINETIARGRMFLKESLRKDKSLNMLDQMIRELKDYEKQSFENDDEQSQWIQKLSTQYFHVRILMVMLLSPVRTDVAKKLITDKIESMNCLIMECKKYMVSNNILEKSSSRFQESLNRLVYSRLELIETLNKNAIYLGPPRRF